MLHLAVKKVGKIPDGGGWRIHGRGSTQTLAGKRAHRQRAGYTYLHSAIDGYSRLAYTEALENETAQTTIGFFSRARACFAAHGITRIAAQGLPLDPNQHQAMLEIPTDEHEPGTVVQEMQSGWMIKDRLLRPAMVGVAKKG